MIPGSLEDEAGVAVRWFIMASRSWLLGRLRAARRGMGECEAPPRLTLRHQSRTADQRAGVDTLSGGTHRSE